MSRVTGAGSVIRDVRRNKHMRSPRLTKWLTVGVISFGILGTLIWMGRLPNFEARLREVIPGMTETDVRKALGSPTWTEKTEIIGAGGERVISWRYVRGHRIPGHWIYAVDFDYVGPGGTPAVFRTTRSWQERRWPSWWPPARAKARA